MFKKKPKSFTATAIYDNGYQQALHVQEVRDYSYREIMIELRCIAECKGKIVKYYFTDNRGNIAQCVERHPVNVYPADTLDVHYKTDKERWDV